jgi:aryl-alcohol dehydrogenase-like predicted oxidoreductase
LRYRQLGDSDLQVSEICLGTWMTFGGILEDVSPQPEYSLLQTVQAVGAVLA